MFKKLATFLKKPSFPRYFSSEKDPTAMVRRLYNSKDFPNDSPSSQDPPDYSAMVQSLENMTSIDQKTFMKHLHEIHKEIHLTIVKSFENPNIRALLNSVRSETLCEMAIESFVGSISNLSI